jgi:hypothetical protein
MQHYQPIPDFLPAAPLEMANGRESLGQFQGWLHDQFLAGSPVGELVAARSHFIDQLLSLCWEQFGLAEQPQLALVAVGVIVGGFIGVTFMCLFQINKDRHYIITRKDGKENEEKKHSEDC